MAIAFATLVVGYQNDLLAQTASLNAKQRWLAGEPLPVNAAARSLTRRAAQRQRTTAEIRSRPRAREARRRDQRIRADRAGRTSRRPRPCRGVPSRTLSSSPSTAIATWSRAARELAAQPGVVYAEPEWRRYPTYTPNDPLYHLQWNFQKLDMERTWDINRGAQSSLVVAVIDSGRRLSSTEGPTRQAPDLEGHDLRVAARFHLGRRHARGSRRARHARHRAPSRSGPATTWASPGMAFNVTHHAGQGALGTVGRRYWARRTSGPSAIACRGASLRRRQRRQGDQHESWLRRRERRRTRCHQLRDLRRARSSSRRPATTARKAARIVYPAAFASEIQGLIAVAALDFNLQRAPYSNSNPYVEISAPGGDTLAISMTTGSATASCSRRSTPSRQPTASSTSSATSSSRARRWPTPHVAGLAALLMTQGVTDPKAVEAVIERFATDIGPAGRDNDTGFGVINPRATIRGLGISK